jgi:hypothetical protein
MLGWKNVIGDKALEKIALKIFEFAITYRLTIRFVSESVPQPGVQDMGETHRNASLFLS